MAVFAGFLSAKRYIAQAVEPEIQAAYAFNIAQIIHLPEERAVG